MDKFYVYRPMLDLIGFTEGTDKGRGYNETLAYGAYTGGDVSLVTMTLDALDKLQTKMLSNPANKWKSSACGRYQIVRTTARNIRGTLDLDGKLLFDANMQDRMACFLLGQRGIDKWLSGRLTENTLINNLAKEWASLPKTDGKGNYDGQNAAIPASRVRSTLAEVRKRHLEGQPVETVEVTVPVPVDKPVVPATVEKEVRQKSNWLSGIFATIFGAGGIGGFLAGMDRDALILVAGVAVVVSVGVLLGGEWMVRRVRSIRKAIEE